MKRNNLVLIRRISLPTWLLLLAWLLLIGLPLGAAAQTGTGRITGMVTDSTGAVLPGVTVTVKNSTTGEVRSTVSDSNGRYMIESLAPGSYELTFDLLGFASQTSSVVVVPGQPSDTETRLEIGGRTEAVEVTGSLIPRPALESMSPVTTLEVEELTYRGMTRLEDLLTTLPQVFVAQNSTISNGATGTATVDLRFLGSFRTLVLIDGRRLGTGDVFDPAPDLNFIPSALVKRVDVLTGGASSTYGADAVAGVVNFILDRDFTGFRGGVEYSGYQHDNRNALAQSINAAKGFPFPKGNAWNDGPSDFNIAFGSKFADNKGHASFYLDYRTTNAIRKDARDYTNCSVFGGMTMSGPTCGGSSTWSAGRFSVFNADFSTYRDYVLDLNSATGDQLRPRVSADVYNYAPDNFMQRPDKRWAGGAFLNYEWNRHLQVYGDIMFMDDSTDAQIASSGDFGNTGLLNCDNPLLSAQEVQLLCTNMGYGPHDVANVYIFRRSVESGGRIAHINHTDLRYSVGVKGDLDTVWNYDVYALQATVRAPQSYSNDFNRLNVQNALLVTADASGNPVCIQDAANGCVPWNIFKKGGVTQAALAYLSLDEVMDTGTRTRVFSGTLKGDLKAYGIESPMAVEAVKVALGFEYREEYMFYRPDYAFENALGTGSGGSSSPPISGSYSMKEYFAEGLIPLVQDHHLVKDLSLEAGYRLSDYSTSGTHSTYKLQASYAPTPDVRVRAGYNRATRAPNIVELYYPQSEAIGGGRDSCAGSSPKATQAQCALMGVPADWYGRVPENPAGQCNVLYGGNPNLTPETADTWTAGLVVTPRRFIPGSTATLDYYDITLNQTIGVLNAAAIQTQCAVTGSAFLCGLIHRDQLHSLWMTTDGYVIDTNLNVGRLRTKGLDVNVAYARPLGSVGVFSASLLGSYLMRKETDTPEYEYDCVGYFGNTCWLPTPSWRHLARFSLETKYNVTVSVGWRMTGRVLNEEASPNPVLANPDDLPLQKANGIDAIPAFHYMDLGVTWKIRKGVTFIAGVNNVFDKEPPLAPGQSANDYAPGFYGTYDPLGRFIHTGLQFTF